MLQALVLSSVRSAPVGATLGESARCCWENLTGTRDWLLISLEAPDSLLEPSALCSSRTLKQV
jgi:hypothetical protein